MQDRYYYLILVIVILFLMSCLWWVWNVSNEMEDSQRLLGDNWRCEASAVNPVDESEIPVSADHSPVVAKHTFPVIYVPPGGYFVAFIPPGEEDRADALAEARWVNKVTNGTTAPYPLRPLHPLPSGNNRGIGFVLHNTQGTRKPADATTRSTGPPYPVPLQQTPAQLLSSKTPKSLNSPHPVEQVQPLGCGDTTIEIPPSDSPCLDVPKHPIQQPLPDTNGIRVDASTICPYPLHPVPSAPLEDELLTVLPIRLGKTEENELKVPDKLFNK